MPANTYTPSVNIIRDANRPLVYYPTPNAMRVVSQIANDFKQGQRAFNVIGAYGTGKSSLLWALEQSLRAATEPDRKRFFDVNLLPDAAVDVVNVVGEYASIIETIANRFGAEDTQTDHVLQAIYDRYHDLGKQYPTRQPLLMLVVDEFGKFLEYAVKHEPEQELYFVQRLAEFANDTKHNICLVTTVHQNTDAYASKLSEAQRKEWTKVKGRLREITFNEPVEQLLFLAGEHLANRAEIANRSAGAVPGKAQVKAVLKLAQSSKALSLDKSQATDIAAKLSPLDPLSASTLALALQRYGQNERSLFSFLESTDHTGLSRIRLSEENPFYNVANVVDYLTFNFYAYLSTNTNPDYIAWRGIRMTLEKVEGQFGTAAEPYEKLVKTVGLLAIFMPHSATLDKAFLVQYAQWCLGILDAEQRIGELETWNIIKYRNYRGRYILNEGSDLDVQVELSRAGNDVDQVRDVATLLQRYYQLPPVMAKRDAYRTGTPRVFEYWISERPLAKVPEGEIDGYINLIFTEYLSLEDIRAQVAGEREAILYVYYQHTVEIRDHLFGMEKTKLVMERHDEDKVALRELEQILEHQTKLLNHLILDGLFEPKKVTWLFQGETKTVASPRELNQLLSEVCEAVYEEAPVFRNELVNRHKYASSIGLAKRNYLKAMVEQWGEPDLGFSKDLFPPEKTIFLTLLAQNGLYDTFRTDRVSGDYVPTTPTLTPGSTFEPLWKKSGDFIDSAKQGRRSVAEFVETLNKRPLKLKQGLIEFWVPTYLLLRRDDYAFFEDGIYVPNLSWETLELILKDPKRYAIKTFGVDGLRLNLLNEYRHLFQQTAELRFSNQSFIETIKPLLTFYRDLPDYAKHTKRLSREAVAVRLAIEKSQEPEKTFFEDLPTALGYTADELQTVPDRFVAFVTGLQDAVQDIRTAYDGLIGRFEAFLLTEFLGEKADFAVYQARLQNRFTNVPDDLLQPPQRTFLSRLRSQLDDRNAWLNSLSQALVGKPLSTLRDADEAVLHDRFRRMMRDLDNVTYLTPADIDGEQEEVFSLKIGTLVEGLHEQLVRMPRNKRPQVEAAEKVLRKQLSNDNVVNIAALTNILKDLLNK
ncbi:hypothetical protein [Fibrella aquatilis]|uniref:Uncharacterized protein n=1 Tax=Fibrella aquatilis TaxID=2817059 RepID=A0A939G6W8_9BACT|nr:hypothetical protein [Fibrella aquatilis]MBO0933289.1 hypothetical protein [Fibrella aquatilis]